MHTSTSSLPTDASSKKQRTKRRWIRAGLWTLGIALLLPVIAWISAATYVHTHREEVLANILDRLNENLGGTLAVEKMEPSMFEDFPNASVVLRGIVLRDSLWPQHRRDLFKAKRIFVRVSPFSAVRGKLIIREVQVLGGALHLFTDANGYSNAYLLKSRDTAKKERREGPAIRKAGLENVSLLIENAPKSKRFKMLFRNLQLSSKEEGKIEKLDIKTNTFIEGLAFNIPKGAFLSGKTFSGSFKVSFDKEKRVLDIPQQRIHIDDDPVRLAASFRLLGSTPDFQIRIAADDIALPNARALLSQSIQQKLKLVSLKEPATLEAEIRGKMKFRDTPLVFVKFRTENNTLGTPGGELKDCDFSGSFFNMAAAGQGYGDPNSIIIINQLTGIYEGIPLTVDTASIRNLKSPKLYTRIRSKFPATAINNVSGGKPFRFTKGNASFNIHYQGSVSLTDTVIPALSGTLSLTGADGVYTPRGLPLNGISAQLVFEGTSVRFPKVAFRTGSSAVNMQGVAQNILLAMHRPQAAASLQWSIASPMVDLADFLPFLQSRSGVAPTGGNGRQSPLADRLDEVLDRADAHLTANISAAKYKQFNAEAVQADVLLTRTHVVVKRAGLRHAGGSLEVSGEATQGGNGNAFAVKAGVRSVNVAELFNSFNNFGQDALKAENIRGLISFDADLKGRLAPGGALVRQSMAGNLRFDVRKGALLNFTPLEKVARYIFKRRNLSDLRFEVLQATFHLANDRIEIEPMEVRSSALSLNLVGVYGLEKGTDISFQVPLRNPKKDSVDLIQDANFEAGDRGIVVHLRAQNPTGQKLDIDWDKGGKLYKKRVGGGNAAMAVQDEPVADEENRKEERKKRRRKRD